MHGLGHKINHGGCFRSFLGASTGRVFSAVEIIIVAQPKMNDHIVLKCFQFQLSTFQHEKLWIQVGPGPPFLEAEDYFFPPLACQITFISSMIHLHESSCYLLTSLTLCNHYLFIHLLSIDTIMECDLRSHSKLITGLDRH